MMNKYNDTIKLLSSRLDELTRFSNCSYDKLLEAERYSVTAGGKHLRGLILLETAKMGKISSEAAIDYACALEMVHTYSLIHDDLPEMDNDNMRRGLPTCHVKYGTDMALLAGDALLTKAFSVIASDTNFSDDKKIECIRILADACGEHGMLAGQTIDKLSENTQIDYERLVELHSRKTADMFCAAVKIGCVLGNIPNDIEAVLTDAMNSLGLIFQIRDDILDVISDSKVLGKPVNSDEKSGKSTFVSLLGQDKSQALLEKLMSEAKQKIALSGNSFFLDLADFFVSRTK